MDTKKLRKLCLKDFVKDSPAQRLTSIKLPRDLSLGGTKINKKVYKPNLNVVRNKITSENKPRDSDKPKSKHQKVREKVKQRFIQSTGVFSEGILSDHVPSIPAVKVRVRELPEKVNLLIPPVEKPREIVIKQEEQIYEGITESHDSSDTDSDEKLSFKPVKWNEALFRKIRNDESKIFHVHKTFLECDYEKPTLNLWQLPDTFNFKKDNDKSNRKNDYVLSDIPEGRIGKLCIRKSGKVDVFIGKLSYEIESSEWECFSEDLMSIDIDSKLSSASVLGHLEQRYILSPDWNCLL